ncbi:hypothetical protein PAXINDRAFT_19426 [Paxillus involutus ATCC 200175]|uniref:Uncharacterized protein n=1 Tax=Paxillus involutus ATCC 200175 TaxID=664439 RepID=A0A0C9SWV4_PAXIN|nr:hypothetical protein PAXINDRAFT_19426 [Paxillus involutus ATCC 200175]
MASEESCVLVHGDREQEHGLDAPPVFPNCDKLTVPSPSSSPCASTIAALAQYFCYAQQLVQVDDMERGLQAVVTDVLRRRQKGDMTVEVGVSSSDGRDERTGPFDIPFLSLEFPPSCEDPFAIEKPRD